MAKAQTKTATEFSSKRPKRCDYITPLAWHAVKKDAAHTTEKKVTKKKKVLTEIFYVQKVSL